MIHLIYKLGLLINLFMEYKSVMLTFNYGSY